MIIKKRTFVLFFGFAAFLVMLFSNINVKSNRVGPQAFYCNDPNPVQATLNCTYCHSSFTAFHDSTNFILQIGTDTNALSEMISGVTTYTPGVRYFLRMNATSPAAVHGFEITAEDTTLDATNNDGTEVTNFDTLNSVNTTLLNLTAPNYKFVTHHNANSNRVWTFTWTAPTTYEGPVTFYYAGNAGVDSDTNLGDSIFVATKTIAWSGLSGVPQIGEVLSSFAVYPTVFDDKIQVSFNLKENANVQGSIFNMNGQVVKSILNEHLSAGRFNRSFDLSGLAAGIYLVKMQMGDAFEVRKIVKY